MATRHRRDVTTRPPPGPAIREAEDRDRGCVLELAQAALSSTSPQARSLVEAWWSSRAVGRFVIEQGGEVAGFYLLGFMVGAGGAHLVGEVLAIAVHPAAQRRGLARAMLEHAARVVAAAAHAAVARALDVQVAAHNEAALRLYRGAGLVEVAGAGGRYPDGTPALRLRRAIAVATD